jgi:hypothetical protein
MTPALPVPIATVRPRVTGETRTGCGGTPLTVIKQYIEQQNRPD